MSMKRIAAIVFLALCAACQKEPAPGTGPDSSAGKGPAPEAAKPVKVKFETSCGDFVIEVRPEWSPLGAKRFLELVKNGFYDDARFFRVVPGFVVQFGMNGDPTTNSHWMTANIRDEPVKASNRKKTICFAKTDLPNTRTTQVFLNLADNNASGRTDLDRMGFAAFGEIVSGWEAVEKINSEYGQKPDQSLIASEGNAYLDARFPGLDYIKKATILP